MMAFMMTMAMKTDSDNNNANDNNDHNDGELLPNKIMITSMMLMVKKCQIYFPNLSRSRFSSGHVLDFIVEKKQLLLVSGTHAHVSPRDSFYILNYCTLLSN